MSERPAHTVAVFDDYRLARDWAVTHGMPVHGNATTTIVSTAHLGRVRGKILRAGFDQVLLNGERVAFEDVPQEIRMCFR